MLIRPINILYLFYNIIYLPNSCILEHISVLLAFMTQSLPFLQSGLEGQIPYFMYCPSQACILALHLSSLISKPMLNVTERQNKTPSKDKLEPLWVVIIRFDYLLVFNPM